MAALFLRLRAWWETADRTQKVVTIFGGAFLAFLLIGTFYFSTRPKMALAYGGLSPRELGDVVTEIQKFGIAVEYDLQGNVRVPSDKIAEVHAQLARSGVSTSSAHSGNGDLASMNMMQPKSVEEARLTAIREGEIAKTIEVIAGVESARVLINPGQKKGFASEDEPPTASVTITEASGAGLGGDQGKAIASLVAKAVPGLDIKNVSIVNQDGVTLYDGADAQGASGRFATKGEAQANEAKRIKRELQPILDRAFGRGNTLLTVRVEMDFDQAKERSELIKPHDTPINKASVVESMNGSGAGASGSPSGAGANTRAPGAGGGASEGSYTSNQKDEQFPYDKIFIEKDKAPGTVTSLAISVLVDQKNVKNVDAVKKALEGYVKPQLNPASATANSFAVTVTPVEFDRTADAAAKAQSDKVAGGERMQQIFALLPIAALIFAAFLVIKALTKVAKSGNVMVQALPGGGFVALGQPAADGTVAPLAARAGMVPAGAGGSAYELVGTHALGTVRSNEPRPDVGEIAERLDVPLEQIKKLAGEKPATVAMLIKGWLVEDRR